ncbi:MAG: 4-(cytidine 5'-diphospho)-2-C-methyl-D-erythritol kinase [Candidatus Omnitrophota bacterium]|nr:4-(cytidine 5'-diphospho)-2-C-methyl-D-erythritol kinase [Candidatus Omnitrophota bacterium]
MHSPKSLKNNPFPQSFSLRSPAKLNLYLKVLNKRKDGFHNIETVFEKIDLCDQLILKNNRAGRIHISSNHPHCPANKTNLAYKAASMLKSDLVVSSGVDIAIKKMIPVASGLGGGASNAAFTLLGLNRLWGLHLSQKQLLNYAQKIGSDVAFFINPQGFARGEGRGEKITPLNKIKPIWHVLVVPNIKLSTAEAYKRIEALRKARSGFKKRTDTKILTKGSSNVNILIRALRKGDYFLLSECLFNDFSSPLFRTYPGLLKIKDRLEALVGKRCSFSGKGPSIFGLVKSRKEALAVKKRFTESGCQVFVVRTFLARS